MSAANEKISQPGQPEFQVFPKETLQACVLVFDEVERRVKPALNLGRAWTSAEKELRDFVHNMIHRAGDGDEFYVLARAPALPGCEIRESQGPLKEGPKEGPFLKSAQKFPVTTLVGSKTWEQLWDAVQYANKWLGILTTLCHPSFQPQERQSGAAAYYTTFDGREVVAHKSLEKFLIVLPCFHDTLAVVDDQGIVISETCPVRQVHLDLKKEGNEYRYREKLEGNIDSFDEVVAAVHMKVADSQRRAYALEVSIDKTPNLDVTSDDEMRKSVNIDQSPVESEKNTTTMPTPSETRASSPTPTERPHTTNTPISSQEPIDNGPVLTMTADQCRAMMNFKAFLAKDYMRDWVNKKGLADKVSEKEIDDLVKKMF
ncbi:hypothetical protein K491DRAFT_731328 [Lophiostoma macrostomum CBS 122681]|uniref:Uncharacterized protein n=1 Tax=Lophiostoma macrostomum CBS 122681 TaxID=1314788 RepID=A0A6A6SVM7_9PLEO|nr:hypothetical protein K491DRAFT_731328 [Lophiostoma macrostomum CBS 122681]